MSNQLPNRPNLEHLRKQAKDLLSSLRSGDKNTAREFSENLPAMSGKSASEIAGARLTLSDAHSVVARKHGFASWQRLVRHTKTLNDIQGIWQFTSLEIEGSKLPESMFANSTLTIDGRTFRMASPDATYSGICTIEVEQVPHTIDIHFEEGPERGQSSFGIFEFDGRELKICLGLTGVGRPLEFQTKPGSGQALETLRRSGIEAEGKHWQPDEAVEPPDGFADGFGEITSEIERLQGQWVPVSVVSNGVALPDPFLRTGSRVMTGIETVVRFGGQVYLQGLTRIDIRQDPIAVDYLVTGGPHQGSFQLGIMRWEGSKATFCMSVPGALRPSGFDAPAGSNCTLTTWKRAEG